MGISVIIPTYRRLGTLVQALFSLMEQTLPAFEALIVDNAVDLRAEQAVAEFNQAARVPVRYVPEPRQGLHYARHAGVRAARGDILVFTDDDATFDPGWLQAYADAFDAHPDMVAAGGPVRPVWEAPPPAWLIELAGDIRQFGALSLMEPYETFQIGKKLLFYGVNMAIRRNTLFDNGGFHPESFGDVWLGDGETGLNWKLWERNARIGYVPDALVHHHILPSRMTSSYLCLRSANQGAADMYTLFHREAPSRRGLLALLCSGLMRDGGKWLRATRNRRRNNINVYSIRFQIEAAYSLGQWKYVWRMLWSRRFRALVARRDWLNDVSKND